MERNWKFKLGIVLMGVSIVAFLLIPVVPFLNWANGVKITATTVLFVVGEITFWTGGLLLGKELLTKYKSYLNPKNWFRRRKDEPESDQTEL